MGSKLDSRQFGLMGRRESPFTNWPDLPVSVDRAAARPRHGHAAHNQSSLSTDHRVVRFSLLRCAYFLCVFVMYLFRPDVWQFPEHILARRSLARASRLASAFVPPIRNLHAARLLEADTRTHTRRFVARRARTCFTYNLYPARLIVLKITRRSDELHITYINANSS